MKVITKECAPCVWFSLVSNLIITKPCTFVQTVTRPDQTLRDLLSSYAPERPVQVQFRPSPNGAHTRSAKYAYVSWNPHSQHTGI